MIGNSNSSTTITPVLSPPYPSESSLKGCGVCGGPLENSSPDANEAARLRPWKTRASTLPLRSMACLRNTWITKIAS